jgi:hypothetical protein
MNGLSVSATIVFFAFQALHGRATLGEGVMVFSIWMKVKFKVVFWEQKYVQTRLDIQRKF